MLDGLDVWIGVSGVLSPDFISGLMVRPDLQTIFDLLSFSSLNPPFSPCRVLGWIIQLKLLRSTYMGLHSQFPTRFLNLLV